MKCDEAIYFNCDDNKTCIPNALICDGYSQCPDSSDEKPELCESCPRKYGHPPRRESEQFLNSFPCQHWYTNKSICAIRCDGRDDLCFDFADEVGCGENDLMKLLMFAFLFVLALSMILYFLDKKSDLLNSKTLDTK